MMAGVFPAYSCKDAPPAHHEYILAAGDALYLVGYLMGESLLWWQAVGELVGDTLMTSGRVG
jgi:hypothetical protein